MLAFTALSESAPTCAGGFHDPRLGCGGVNNTSYDVERIHTYVNHQAVSAETHVDRVHLISSFMLTKTSLAPPLAILKPAHGHRKSCQ